MRRQALVALIALTAVSFGCGKMETNSGTASRKAASPGEKSAALPDNFPRDVPILKNATVKVVISQAGRTVVHFYTSSSIAEAGKFYNGEFKSGGWTVEDTSTTSELYSATAKKGRTLCGVTISKEGKWTLVRLAVSEAGS